MSHLEALIMSEIRKPLEQMHEIILDILTENYQAKFITRLMIGFSVF